MANRRCLQALTRHYTSIISPSSSSLQYLKILNPQLQALALINPSQILSPKFHHISTHIRSNCYTQFTIARHFSSNQRDDKDNEDEDDDDDDEEIDDSNDDENVSPSNSGVEREYSPEEKENEAAAIGYKVIGPLQRSDRVFKDYEPVFAVIQIGSHQFKVSNGDCIYTERLKFCEVHDKLILNKVLMLGSATQTLIGRPLLPDATVHAVVEEHALDAKVIIFKKKRRKNYRRTKGHRQELTKLRITDIQGIEKPEKTVPVKTKKTDSKKVAVAA